MTDPEVQIIVRTTASVRRRTQLLRAIESIVSQKGVIARPIVVANGRDCDETILATLRNRDDVRLIRQVEGDPTLALLTGRRYIDAPYFSVLDDDDEYLPGALQVRLRTINEPEPASVVITNGYVSTGDSTRPLYESMVVFSRSPLNSLVDHNWLASCGGMFRTSDVPTTIFDLQYKYFEWTAIAFRIAQAGLPIRFIEDTTFVIHDTADSLSKSVDYVTLAPECVGSLARFPIPAALRYRLLRKKSRLHHEASKALLETGDLVGAWQHHAQSMAGLYGVGRHAPFTARIGLRTFRFLLADGRSLLRRSEPPS